MGYYIEVPKNLNKAKQLVDMYKAEIIPQPSSFSEIPLDKALICVVSNGLFDAAALCYSPNEFQEFARPSDVRRKEWLIMDSELAHKLSGYQGR